MADEIKKESSIPDFSQSERSKVPEAYTWRAADIYPDPDAWEKDKAALFKMMDEAAALEKDWASSPGHMFRLLDLVSEIDKKENRLYTYTSLHADTDMAVSSWQAKKGELQTASVNFGVRMAFMEPGILKLGKQRTEEYIDAEPRLEAHRVYLESVLRMKKHILATDKEQIITQTGLFSGATSKAAGMLNDVDIPAPQITLSSGKKIRLSTSGYVRYRDSSERADRVKVMRKYWRHRAKFKNTHAALLDGAMKSHLFRTKVRRFDSCLHAALFPNKIDLSVYRNLVETVENNLAPLHRYMKLKTRLLKLDKMSYDDIYASCVPSLEKTFTMDEAGRLVMDAMKPLGGEYGDVLKKGLDGGWMDMYPNKGKRSGAYSNGSVYDVHPFVLMNYNGAFNHVSTLAHEFGHALHSWFSNKNQPYPLSHYPIFLAEVASTFNETLLVHYMLEHESDGLFKLYILDRYLDEFRGTLYRQTLFAQFELAMHEHVEKGQTLTPEWLDKEYLALTRKYYGHKEGITRVDKYIETEWNGIPHFYYNFYVYQYSTGIAAATMLAKMVREGGSKEKEKYLDFLKSGCSKYPLDTLKAAGVDLTGPGPVQTAVDTFNDIVSRMETILETSA
jgi:oligoendopeptidase F